VKTPAEPCRNRATDGAWNGLSLREQEENKFCMSSRSDRAGRVWLDEADQGELKE
jgi:hypothetical protein